MILIINHSIEGLLRLDQMLLIINKKLHLIKKLSVTKKKAKFKIKWLLQKI